MKVKVRVEYFKVTIIHDGNSGFCQIISKVHSISKQFYMYMYLLFLYSLYKLQKVYKANWHVTCALHFTRRISH